MALDPPLTADEEALIVLVRSLQTKEQEVATAEQTATEAAVRANSGREALRNLKDEFVEQMHKRGIGNPEALLRQAGSGK